LQTQLPDKISSQNIKLVNLAAVKLCANDIIGAKEVVDELLHQLDVKLVNPDSSSESMLP
jgi:hypothetical protein